MRSKNWQLVAIAALGLCATGALFFERGPDPVIFPHQEIPIFFNHDYHVRVPDEKRDIEGEGLSCTFCHDEIEDSVKSSDRDIPGHDDCDSCHAEWIGDEEDPAPSNACAFCHKDLPPTGTATVPKGLSIPAPNIVFSHAAHTKAEVACVECHKNVPSKTVATRDDYPTMDRCIACHEERGAPTTCVTCHVSAKQGRIQAVYPEGELKPNRYHTSAIHDANFLRDHAVPAQRDGQYCKNCHAESDCLQCHDGVARDTRYHPGDWIAMHPIRARKDDFRCQSCHRFQTFCINCHVRSGVASIGTVQIPVQRRTVRRNPATGVANGPHPMTADGWLDPLSRNFHGFHAQRNIRACAGCHQEQYCVQCHGSAVRSGVSIGGNPHGPNPERLRGSTASKRNARACLKCHSPTDPSWR